MQSSILDSVEEAFVCVRYPFDKGITSEMNEQVDRRVTRSFFEQLHWRKLNAGHTQEYIQQWFMLTPEGFRYYLPGFLTLLICSYQRSRDLAYFIVLTVNTMDHYIEELKKEEIIATKDVLGHLGNSYSNDFPDSVKSGEYSGALQSLDTYIKHSKEEKKEIGSEADQCADLVKRIREAFKDVILGEGVSLSLARYHDYGLAEDLENAILDERECWDSIPDEILEKYQTALSFTDSQGFRFYIPAYRASCKSLPASGNLTAR